MAAGFSAGIWRGMTRCAGYSRLRRAAAGRVVNCIQQILFRENGIGVLSDHWHAEAGEEILDDLNGVLGCGAMVFGPVANIGEARQHANMIVLRPSAKGFDGGESLWVFRQTAAQSGFELENGVSLRQAMGPGMACQVAPFVEMADAVDRKST